MKSKQLSKNFKCPYCEKIYPTTNCSNFMFKGNWVCKPCNKTFIALDLYAEDIDHQAFTQNRKSGYNNGE